MTCERVVLMALLIYNIIDDARNRVHFFNAPFAICPNLKENIRNNRWRATIAGTTGTVANTT